MCYISDDKEKGIMEVNMNVQDDVLYVEIVGNLNNKTSPDLEAQLEEKREGVNAIVIDASKLEYISSAGLRVIMATELYMKKSGKRQTKFINANDDIMEVIEMCGFNNVVEVE